MLLGFKRCHMNKQESLKWLRGGPDGITQWNRFRATRERVFPLQRANLSRAGLANADLHGVDLREANLRNADLREADFSDAVLSGADLVDADARRARFTRTDLRSADLMGARLSHVNLSGANIESANLLAGDLFGANVSGARLVAANLSYAKLIDTNLLNADLCCANLSYAVLIDTELAGADFRTAVFGTTVVACDLSGATGLDETRHSDPSFVDVNSALQFRIDLPEKFLRGCGLRDEEIAYFRSAVRKPVQFYSCFVSYSTVDEDFAARLYSDFQAAGIRCWKWDHDARTGRPIWGEISKAIRAHDKLVLIASESSLSSPAVNREIERAIRLEDERLSTRNGERRDADVDVLFPVRLDDFILKGWEHERKVDVTSKVIADARGWSDDERIYARVRDRLLRDLKPEDATSR